MDSGRERNMRGRCRLNLVVAIMSNTYQQVKDNLVPTELRGRSGAEETNVTRSARWVRGFEDWRVRGFEGSRVRGFEGSR
eukprot:2712666-Rhodomonas_salina.1